MKNSRIGFNHKAEQQHGTHGNADSRNKPGPKGKRMIAGLQANLVVFERAKGFFEIILVEFTQILAAGLMNHVTLGVNYLQPGLASGFHGSQSKNFQLQ